MCKKNLGPPTFFLSKKKTGGAGGHYNSKKKTKKPQVHFRGAGKKKPGGPFSGLFPFFFPIWGPL